jgi:SAM-dependent methyltransferase
MANPYPARFLDLLPASAGLALDVGCGARSLPGVVGVEYAPTAGAAVVADGAALPFADGTFAVALSQAVLEHVPEPKFHMRELARVLKPGGILVVEAAFMQPVHLAPHHYFNVTPFGLAWLLADAGLEELELGPLGTVQDVFDDVSRAIGAGAGPKAPRASEEGYRGTASGVHAVARKPAVLHSPA